MHSNRLSRVPAFLRLIALVLLVGGVLAVPFESIACNVGDEACTAAGLHLSSADNPAEGDVGDDCCASGVCDHCCAPGALTLPAMDAGAAILAANVSPPHGRNLFEAAPTAEAFRPPIAS